MSEESIETVIARDLHKLLYLKEFTFATNTFSPAGRSEVELADAVVVLDDTLLVFQIKERSIKNEGGAEAERAWFKTKVLKEAKNQIRDTVKFLNSSDEIKIANQRGRIFNLASGIYKSIVKIIVYHPSKNLPNDSRSVRHYRSKTVGFIHIISHIDYLRLSSALRVPEEIIRYFEYRERVITQFPTECSQLPEASLVGGFIGDEDKPKYKSYLNLHRAVDDENTWDLIPILSRLHDNYTLDGYAKDYYDILIEFMRLPRSMWREIKKRFVLSVEKVRDDKQVQPYRVSFPDRDIGFLFLPFTSEISLAEDWDEFKVIALTRLTALHKFDHRLKKCIGISMGKIGEIFDINWCMINEPWQEDLELRAKLDRDSPFRPASEKLMHGFFLQD